MGAFSLIVVINLLNRDMSSSLTDDDVNTIRDVLRQISGLSSNSTPATSTSCVSNTNPALNGATKPPKGTKIFNKRNEKWNMKMEEKRQQQQQKKVNPALHHKMMRLAKMNLL